MRIAIGFTEVSGFNRSLKAGFQALGHRCHFYNCFDHPFGYGEDDPGWLIRAIRNTQPKSNPTPWQTFVHGLLKTLLVVWMTPQFDVLIVSKNQGLFLNYWDIRWFRGWGKTIVFQFHGSDVRPPYLNGAVLLDEGMTWDYCRKLTQRLKRRINRVDRLAHWIIDSPCHAHFHQKKVLNRLYMGRPYLPTEALVSGGSEAPGTGKDPEHLKILHCPSKRLGKGSWWVEQVMVKIQARFPHVQYEEISGRPHDEVLRALQGADIVIDQLFNDIGFSGFAVEAAWAGKPVIMGGYPLEAWVAAETQKLLPPFAFTHPAQLEQTLVELIQNPEKRLALGQDAKAFVETQWHPKAVAERYLKVLEGEAPEGWWIDPKALDYLDGWGLPDPLAREAVRSMVTLFGQDALHLAHAPAVQEKLIAYAGLEQPLALPPVLPQPQRGGASKNKLTNPPALPVSTRIKNREPHVRDA